MASLNQALSIANAALSADQAAIAVVSGNTANANTPGFTKQSVQFTAVDRVSLSGGTAVAGVNTSAPASQRDRLLNQRIDQQTQDQAGTAARLSALQDLQTSFAGALNATGAAGSGAGDIGQQLSSFFLSFSSLAADPSNVSLRGGVLSAAKSLAGSFNQAASSLNQQRAGLDATVGSIAGQVNALTQSIADLNGKITSASPEGDAGTLEDQRQYDLEQLSQLVGIHQITNDHNSLTITTTAGVVLVAGSTSTALQTHNSGGVTGLTLGGVDQTAALSSGGGQLGGLLQARDSDIPSALQSLDQLASNVGSAVNAQQANGVDLNGSAGGPIFSLPGSVNGSAGAISVVLTDPNGIAAAAARAGAQDGSNATALATLASSGVVGGQKPADAYAALISSIGSAVKDTTSLQAAQSASLSQLKSQQSALSSVDLNQQAALLQSYEQSYQAAAKVFTILDTVIASALNLGVQTTVG
jgi:flagellar hook-associated protein 1 FlgK